MGSFRGLECGPDGGRGGAEGDQLCLWSGWNAGSSGLAAGARGRGAAEAGARVMRTHQEIDARSLAMHRLIAEKVRRDPALLEAAKATLARWRSIGDGSTRPYDEQWERVLNEGLEATVRIALEESERGGAMRQCSPFPGILAPRERFAFLRAWKDSHETSGP